MLSNIESCEELKGIARAKSREYVTRTVSSTMVQDAISESWIVQAENKRTVRIIKKKEHGAYFEDRVWSLMYRLGFTYLSTVGGGKLSSNLRDANGPINQIDVVCIDDEVAVAIECKSSEKHSRMTNFQEILGKFSSLRQAFANSVNHQFQHVAKRQVALILFTSNIILSDTDRQRAKNANVALFDELDLAYYEELAGHLGSAARYQFLADLLPGKKIHGLQLRVPAIRSKMGKSYCYTFSVSPSYLLKIGFVSHRAKGKASDVNTYQRMIRKSRLRRIREYIDEDGIFPTNIVISLDTKPVFHQISQETDLQSDRMGWLELRPAYKSAWIIDGQHRLYAYSGHPKAEKAHLAVLAFENLEPSLQAELFIDINAQQKSVKQSLLQELYAELHWDADDRELRLRAIISKAIQTLNADPESPFYQRILTADERKDRIRCITLGNLFRSLQKPDLYLDHSIKKGVARFGPLWGGEDNDLTRKRTCYILNQWFATIRNSADDWWNLGADDGGGLSMNDGVTACIDVLRSVFGHLERNGESLVHLEDQELAERIQPYSNALGQYLSSLTTEERKQFRNLRGVQGVTTRTRRCQQAIKASFLSFDPPGLRDFIEGEKAQRNQRASNIIQRIEVTLQRTVIDELQKEFQDDSNQWWFDGIPTSERKAASSRSEDDSDKRGGREKYLDLIDYRSIILKNWSIFGELLGYGKSNVSKDKRTIWIHDVNEIRKIVFHASSGRTVSAEQLAQLENYDRWLTDQVTSVEGKLEQMDIQVA